METPGPSMYLILLILLALSAFFSASETALSSANRVRLRNQAQEGDARAQLALDLIADYDRTISTILVGNNVVNLTASSLSTLVATALLGSQYGPLAATIAVTGERTALLSRYADLTLSVGGGAQTVYGNAIFSRVADLAVVDMLYMGIILSDYERFSRNLDRSGQVIADRGYAQT